MEIEISKPLIPTKSKCKIQAVYLLSRERACEIVLILEDSYTERSYNLLALDLMQLFWLTGDENGAFTLGYNTWRFGVAMDALVLHEKWMPSIQQSDIGRFM